MKTAAVYIRVSTEDQTEYSPDAQLRLAKDYAKAHDMIIDDQFIFRDDGISGRHAKKRPAFNEMILAAKKKPTPFQAILLWKFSRFARNQEESIVYKSMLRKDGIEVVSISEPLVDGPFGSLIERIIEWMDEYYSIRLAGEVNRGMTQKALAGGFQTAAPFGYVAQAGAPLKIEEREAKYIRYIFDAYQAGDSFFAIAGKLNSLGVLTRRGNKFENRTVEYILNNPIYKGYVRWTPTGQTVGKRIYDSPDTIVKKSNHPPIIPEEVFDEVHKQLNRNRALRKTGERPAETKKHYLSGRLKCGSCGATLTYSQANDGFQCINYTHGSCKPSHFIRAGKIEQTIFAELERVSVPGTFIENIRVIHDQSAKQRELIQMEIENHKKMFDRAKSAYLAGIDTLEEYESNKKRIEKALGSMQAELCKITVEKVNPEVVRRKIKSILTLLRSDATQAQKNAALAETVEKITFHRPEEKIVIYFLS